MAQDATSPSKNHGDGRLDLFLVGATLVGAGLRLWDLGAQSLWYDEWLTVEAVDGSLADVLRHVSQREGIGPVYPLLMWLWVTLFGDSEVALRLVSACFGIATVPVTYAATRALGFTRTVWTPRVAALLVAVHPLLVWYSQEARPYSLLAFLAAVSLYLFGRAWHQGRTLDYLLWGLAGALALAVHYFAAFLLLAEAAALATLAVAHARRRAVGDATPKAVAGPGGRHLIAAGLPIAATLLLLAPLAIEQRSHDTNSAWIAQFSLSHRLKDAGLSALTGPSRSDDIPWLLAALVVGMALTRAIRKTQPPERNMAAVVALVGFGAAALALAVSVVGVDVFLGRYLIGALAPLLAAVAVGLTSLLPPPPGRRRLQRGLGLPIVVVALLVGATGEPQENPELQRTDWRSVADVFESGSGPRVLVVNRYALMASPLRHYLPDARALAPDETVAVEEVYLVTAKPSEHPCSFLVGQPCGLVFLGFPPAGLRGAGEDSFRRDLALDEEVELDQFRVDRYRSDGPRPISPAELVGRADTDANDALVLVLGDDR